MIIQENIEPLSEVSLRGAENDKKVILARSDAMGILEQELSRYCKGQIQGRSFLIAGHRGSGKTMLVADALHRNIFPEDPNGDSRLRPLPVFLHGPSLLRTLPSDLQRDQFSLENTDSKDARKSSSGAAGRRSSTSELKLKLKRAAPKVTPRNAKDEETVGAIKPKESGIGTKEATNGDTDSDFTEGEEKRVQLGLVHIILSLHRAVAKEFACCYRRAVLARLPDDPEAGELGARFEIELLEDPRATRLREYWELADALQRGVLAPETDAPKSDQGARELVALNGICNAHQRISGALSQTDTNKAGVERERRTEGGFDVKAVDSLKPLGAVFAGAFVAAGGAVASRELLIPSILGILVTWASTMFLKSTVITSESRKRTIDETFIPDLTPRTLDRVLPILLDRLRGAGLAPVLVIDELDKVDDLPDRIERLVSFLKKLVAENVFSCFLTDRSYFEYLRSSRSGRYARTSSYFTHRLMVSYEPREFDEYLRKLITLPSAATPMAGMPPGLTNPAEIDRTILRWVLRHRSQMHALSLQREIAALRGEHGEVKIPDGAIRSDYQYRIDLTLQVAIELTLYSVEVFGWSQRQPALLPTLFDALYYLSRSWLSGDDKVDLRDSGKQAIIDDLIDCMNLDDLEMKPQSKEGALCQLNDDDKGMLWIAIRSVARYLRPCMTRDKVLSSWREISTRLRWGPEYAMGQEVVVALLLGEDASLLKPTGEFTPKQEAEGKTLCKWRYWRSGSPREGFGPKVVELTPLHATELAGHLKFIDACGRNLANELLDLDARFGGDVFAVLGDHLRVLETSPAWMHVEGSIRNLELVQRGTGDRLSLEQDLRTVKEFAGNLKTRAGAVSRLLCAATMIKGIASKENSPNSILDCATLLSVGLGFMHLDPEGVLTRISEMLGKLGGMLAGDDQKKFETLVADRNVFDLSDSNLMVNIAECEKFGERAKVSWDETVEKAWDHLEFRIRNREDTSGSLPATLEEILLVAIGRVPASFLSSNLNSVTLAEWTALFLRGVSQGAKDGAVPEKISVLAYLQLGGRTISREAGQKFFKQGGAQSLEAELRHSTSRGTRLVEHITSRAAIVVCGKGMTVTHDWHSVPKLGLIFILNDLTKLAKVFAMARIASPDRHVRVLLEAGAVPEKDLEGLKESLWPPDASHVELAFLVSASQSSEKLRPAIIAPTGPDGVFRRLRAKEAVAR